MADGKRTQSRRASKPAASKAPARKRAPRRARDAQLAETPEGLLEPGLATEVPTRLGPGVARPAAWPPAIYWVKVAAAFIVAWVLFQALVRITSVLVLLTISLVLGLGLQPAIKSLERRGMRRGWAVALILIAVLLVIGLFLSLVIPAIVRETTNLIEKAPSYLQSAEGQASIFGRLNEQFDLETKLRDLGERAPATALGLVRSFTSLIFNFLTVLILTSIFAIRLPGMKRGVARLLRREQREDFNRILDESIDRVGGYVIGNIATSAIAGVFAFVFLTIVGVPYAAALAFGVALFDLIPTIGAVIALVAVTIVAFFAQGATIAIITAVVFFVYQQIENYVIQPRVMKRAIDMSPGAVIVAVLIGGSLAGVVGSLLALPIAAIIKIAVQELFIEERLEAVRRTEKPS